MLVVMTPFPYHIEAGSSLAIAVRMMEDHDIRHLPVLEDGDVVGIISERDLERAKILGHPLSEETELTVGDLCTRQPYFVDISDPLDRVLDALAEKRLGSALVLKDGELAGIFTSMDACRLLAQTLREQFHTPPPGDDAA